MKHLLINPSLIGEGTIEIDGDDHHHLTRVMRLGVGAPVSLSDGEGKRYEGHIAEVGRSRSRVTIDRCYVLPPDPGPALVLVDALGRGERAAVALQKSTELGVDEILPALCEHSVARPHDPAHKLKRWREIVRQATRQCGRARLPHVHEVQRWNAALAQAADADIGLVAALGGEPLRHYEPTLRTAKHKVAMAIGPEGGLTEHEVQQAREAGFHPVSLGERVLRTETASVVMVALVAYLTGRFESSVIPYAPSETLPFDPAGL